MLLLWLLAGVLVIRSQNNSTVITKAALSMMVLPDMPVPELQAIKRMSHMSQRVMQPDRQNSIVVSCIATLHLRLCTPLNHEWEGRK